ncbi:DUF7289 family protein [Haladaptatus sp. ZSTT2]|uniref:DUF7289 family protein n=1 Tax=Haladaptatus sp. ZSTT2 TaxID=3120515 RepID=UPI00300F545D
MGHWGDSGQPRGSPHNNWGTATRAQAETIGVVLLLFFVMTTVALTASVGSAGLEMASNTAETSKAEVTLMQLDNRMEQVALGDTKLQTMALGLDGKEGTMHVREGAGSIRVEVFPYESNEVETVLVNEPLGDVVYRNGNVTLAAQGGGLWRVDGDGQARMISAPRFHYKDDTLTLPIIVTSGQTTLDTEAVITEQSVHSQSVYHSQDEGAILKPGSRVRVTIQSDYYVAWGAYFEREFNGTVTYDSAAETASIEFAAPLQNPGVLGGLFSTSPDDVIIKASSGTDFTDSYDSRVGPYDAATAGSNGHVIGAGDVEITTGQVNINGDLIAGGSLNANSNSMYISGNVTYSSLVTQKGTIAGWMKQQPVYFEDVAAIDRVIDAKVRAIAPTNDNANVSALSGTNVDASGGPVTLSAGDYIVDDLTLDGSDEVLVLDLSQGDVNLVVNNSLTVSNGAELRVINSENGTARVWFNGTALTFNYATVTVAGDRANSLWIYAPADADMLLYDGQFTGVIYAPNGGNAGVGSVTIEHFADIKGAIVAGQTEFLTGSSIHFDEALLPTDPIPPTGHSPIRYIHLSVNEIELTESD